MALGVAELADLNEVTPEDLTTMGMTVIQQKRFKRSYPNLNVLLGVGLHVQASG